MKAPFDSSWGAVVLAFGFLGFAALNRTPPKTHPASEALRASDPEETLKRAATPVHEPQQPTPSTPSQAFEFSKAAMEAIHTSGDPEGERLLEWIESNMPPGWEYTFILHDLLVVSGSLTDISRLLSFSGDSDAPSGSRRALSGEALRVQSLADEFARRWLAAKYPMLGNRAIESALLVPNHELLPSLDQFNLVAIEEVLRLLKIPVQTLNPSR